jgi:hypothetical protein
MQSSESGTFTRAGEVSLRLAGENSELLRRVRVSCIGGPANDAPMARPERFLFVTRDSGGNVPPPSRSPVT